MRRVKPQVVVSIPCFDFHLTSNFPSSARTLFTLTTAPSQVILWKGRKCSLATSRTILSTVAILRLDIAFARKSKGSWVRLQPHTYIFRSPAFTEVDLMIPYSINSEIYLVIYLWILLTAPKILSSSKSMHDKAGNELLLSCEVSGFPTPKIEWTYTTIERQNFIVLPSKWSTVFCRCSY